MWFTCYFHILIGAVVAVIVWLLDLHTLIIEFVIRLIRVPLVEHELPTLPEHLRSPPVFSGVRVTWSLVVHVYITCMFCRTLFVLLYFFPLAIVFSVVRILITSLVSSNSSYNYLYNQCLSPLMLTRARCTPSNKQTNIQTNTISLINTGYGH